ncbi:MAG: DUF5677 domain-containing protein [Phycisphaerae bacterium]
MSVHRWRRLPTKHFGEVWVPLAHIQLQGNDGKLHALALQVDSGAVVSLLARSVADLLKLDLESGDRVELSSVGAPPTVAYVHSIESVFAETIRYTVRYAIATVENVPNLLGRLDVFDHLQIDFDASLTETRITPPWLCAEDRWSYEFLVGIENHILERWEQIGFPDPAPKVIAGFVNRMGQVYAGAFGLLKLHRAYSGPLLIRTMFELFLQLEYLLKEPEHRAKLYQEFQHVTQYRYTMAIVQNPTGYITQRIAASPLRAEGEQRIRQEYQRVRPMFEHKTSKGKKKVSNNWYGKRIKELAEELGYGGEYRVLYAACSAWAHGDPFRSGTIDVFAEPRHLFKICTGYYKRMLRSIADTGHVFLTNEQYEFLSEAATQWY